MFEEQILREINKKPLTMSELADSLGVEPVDIASLLKELRDGGKVIRGEEGKYSLSGPIVGEEENKENGKIKPEFKAVDPPKREMKFRLDDEENTIDKEKIVQLLDNADRRLTARELLSLMKMKTREANVREMKQMLHSLSESGKVDHDGGGYYHLRGNPKPHPTTLRLKAGKCGRQVREHQALEAIDKLAHRIDPKPIEDLDLKLRVLRRLSLIIEPSVSRILEAIAQDLEERQ